jgi:hypothetical protein
MIIDNLLEHTGLLAMILSILAGALVLCGASHAGRSSTNTASTWKAWREKLFGKGQKSTRLPKKSFMPRNNSEICINASEVTASFRLR